jgi:simple sugar transport system permease protein
VKSAPVVVDPPGAVGEPPARRRLTELRIRGFGIEPRARASMGVQAIVLGGSLLVALIFGAVLLAVTGYSPSSVYRTIFDASFGSADAFSQTLVQTTPLILTALAAAVAYRAQLYTIGADGQLYIGAIVASGLVLKLAPSLPPAPLITLSMIGGAIGGMLWAGIAAVGRAYLRVNEVISTLMLNFIALDLISYLVIDTHSLWRDASTPGQAQAAPLPSGAALPHLFDQADLGIVIAIGAALALAVTLRRTRWGYELRVVGDSPRTGRYAGISLRRKIIQVLLVSGALAGLAGAILVTSVTQGLDASGLSPGLGYGYTGIVVAAVARLSFIGIIPAAVLMAALLNAGPALAIVQGPQDVVVVLQGAVLLLVAAGQFFLSYRVRRVGQRLP